MANKERRLMLTVTDYFCGAGGSSSGMEAVPGVRVRYAFNHWGLAIATHNANMPHVDHDEVDLFELDPTKYAPTDIGWFSPECTTWSQARGQKVDFGWANAMDELFDAEASDESVERSRLGMDQVVRFVRAHHYRGFVVENVQDILQWHLLDRWLEALVAEGYRFKVVTLNSAFAQGLGAPAPQLRDRVYFVFWRTEYRAPDLEKWTRPRAWCPACEQVVTAVFAPKKVAGRRPMRYGAQYVYRCPNVACRNSVVMPYVLPAASAIDWSLPAQLIGEREKPLQPKTLARIEAGLRRYARPITLEAAGHTFERHAGVRTWPADEPLKTLHASESKAVACPPFLTIHRGGPGDIRTSPASGPAPTLTSGGNHLGVVTPPMLVPSGGTWRDDVSYVDAPMPARTTRENDGLCTPPFLAPLRSGRPRTIGVDEPLATVVADGSNHALIDPMLVPVEGRDGLGARPVTDPSRAQTARLQDALLVPLRNNGVARPAADDPAPTFAAAGQHHALVMRNNTARGDDGQMSTPTDEPIRTITTAGHQSVVRWDHLLVPYDHRGRARQVDNPLPTQTTVQGDALLGPSIAVDDCTFRMLDVHEIKAGMAFAPSFLMPVGSKRDKIRMLGNAVTPPAARDLVAALVEAITGDEIELAGAA
jgi:DNA (cytosine-5)-methyltransferase 1